LGVSIDFNKDSFDYAREDIKKNFDPMQDRFFSSLFDYSYLNFLDFRVKQSALSREIMIPHNL